VKIAIKNRTTKKIIFTHDVPDNTMKLTAEAGIKSRICLGNATLNDMSVFTSKMREANLFVANLSEADLSYSDLSNINLRGADLSNANLRNSNLCNADLRNVNLSNTDISNSNLDKANLQGANLHNALMNNVSLEQTNLCNVVGNKQEIKSMHIEEYDIVFTNEKLYIKDRCFSIEKWKNFTDDDIKQEGGIKLLHWWAKWKGIVFTVIEL